MTRGETVYIITITTLFVMLVGTVMWSVWVKPGSSENKYDLYSTGAGSPQGSKPSPVGAPDGIQTFYSSSGTPTKIRLPGSEPIKLPPVGSSDNYVGKKRTTRTAVDPEEFNSLRRDVADLKRAHEFEDRLETLETLVYQLYTEYLQKQHPDPSLDGRPPLRGRGGPTTLSCFNENFQPIPCPEIIQ